MGKYDARISRMKKMVPRRREIETHLAIYTDEGKEKVLERDTIVLWADDPEIERHNAEVFDRLMYGDEDDEI